MKLTTIDKPEKKNADYLEAIKEGNFFKQMDYAISNSPTASMVALMFKEYCVLPNLKPKYQDLWDKLTHERISYGFYTLWAEYDIDLNLKELHFRPDSMYRVKKKDDIGNVSSYFNTITGKEYPAFNKDKTILASQIEKAGGFEKFSGQIFQYNTTTQPYEITPFFSVVKWMRIEEITPENIDSASDNSLFGNNIFIMKKSAESSVDEDGNTVLTNTDKVIGALRASKSTKKSGTNHVLTVDTEEELSKLMHKIEIGNTIDIDKFNTVDDKAGKKICTAGYCFPHVLASASEGLFSASGESYRAAIAIWSETCFSQAEKIENVFAKMGIVLQEVQAADATVEDNSDVDQTTLDAQATLKGSVGGVQSILAIQTSYAQKLTTYESAMSILSLVFGYNEIDSRNLLGNPVLTPLTPPVV
jgi:hypothetical protein